ncbi:MAG: glycosyltransferase family 4 protein [Dehalococcoidia bacterium]
MQTTFPTQVTEAEEPALQNCNVVHFANPDTVRFILLHELLGLEQGGAKINVLTGHSPAADEARDLGLKVDTIPFTRRMMPFQDLVTLVKTVRYLRRVKPAILHTHNPKPNLIGSIAGTLARVPVIVNTVHGRYGEQGKSRPVRWAMAVLDWLEVRLVNRILTVSEEDVAGFRRFAGKAEDKVRHLGGGILLADYNPDRFTAAEVARKRQELGIPLDHLVIGTVGRLVREKGYLELFQAVQNLVRRNPKVTLLVVGLADPEKSDALTPDIVDEYEIRDHVIFADPTATPEVYSAMDIFALPSYREGLPRTPMEAAAMGKPLVLTNIRGCRQIVDQDRNGYLVPVGDAEALTQALDRLLSDGDLRQEFGEAARQKARQDFDTRKMIRDMLDVYLEETSDRRTQSR